MKAWIIAAALMFLPMPALAQAQLTQADIQRLQDSVYDASADVTRLRQRDARLAEGLERELDDLRDEVIYLKVKMRKSGATRAEYSDLRDRIDRLRSQARGDASPASTLVNAKARRRRTAQRDGDSCRHRVRCTAAVALELGYRRGRRSLRCHDDRALRSQRPGARSGRLRDAWGRQLGHAGKPRHQPEGRADACLRPLLD